MKAADYITDAGTVLPVMHLNGSGEQNLARELTDALTALRTARVALRQAAPNGRDYYPVDGLLARAEDQHARHLEAIAEIETALTEQLEHVLYS